MASLVSKGREVKSGNDPMEQLGRLFKKQFAKFSPKAIIRYLMYLPLNFIPIVGTVLFIILQGAPNTPYYRDILIFVLGSEAGPNFHARYFQLKGWTSSQKDGFVQKHAGAYMR